MKRMILFSLLAMMLLPACQRRDLLVSTNVADLHLIVLDTLGVGKVPSGDMYEMRIYGADDGIYRSSSFVPPAGGEVNLPRGIYDIVIHRFDNPTIIIDGLGEYPTLHAYTNNVSGNTKRYFNSLVNAVMTKAPAVFDETSADELEEFANGDVAWEPDWFFVATHPSLDVPLRDVDAPLVTIYENAMPMVFPCRLTVRGVTGKKHIAAVNAFLTGISRGVYLANGESDHDAVTTTFGLHIGEEGAPMLGDFRIFGFVPGVKNLLFLTITDTAGGSYVATFDVTEQCKNSKKGLNVVINVEIVLDFDVPKPEEAGGGFAPSVEDWNEIVYRIDL